MSGFEELIARLEATDHGDRDLDDAIHTAVGGKDPPPEGALWRHTVYTLSAPWFTTSIDAALTLVPELPRRSINVALEDRGEAVAVVTWDGEPCHAVGRAHNQPALALCIAALRARASLTNPTTPDSGAE